MGFNLQFRGEDEGKDEKRIFSTQGQEILYECPKIAGMVVAEGSLKMRRVFKQVGLFFPQITSTVVLQMRAMHGVFAYVSEAFLCHHFSNASRQQLATNTVKTIHT